jgi:hypothetical protein
MDAAKDLPTYGIKLLIEYIEEMVAAGYYVDVARHKELVEELSRRA